MKKSNTETFGYYLNKYLTVYLPGTRGLATNSIISYRDTFSLLIVFLKSEKKITPERLSIHFLTKDIVIEFVRWLETNRNCSQTSRNQRFVIIRSFCKWLSTENPEFLKLSEEIYDVKLKKAPKPIMTYLSVDAMKCLLSQPDSSTNDGLRDLTLLAFTYDTGARVSEVANLKFKDIRFDPPPIVKILGKGNKTRIVPLLPQTVKYLNEYICRRKINLKDSQEQYLFTNRTGGQLSRSGIKYILDKYVEIAKSQNPTMFPEKHLSTYATSHKSNTLIQALDEENIIRQLAHTFTTASGTHAIPIVGTRGKATWVAEEQEIPETTETFTQKTISAHKLTALIKISEELLNDSAFDLESYIASEFARKISDAEEEAFITGSGTGKPFGILHDKEGAEVGITSAAANAITTNELIDLYYSLRSPYRKRAVWVMNDSTVNLLRKLKDGNGQYIWEPGIKTNDTDTILGRKVYTTTCMPTAKAGAKTVAFGDLSYYWIGDREGISFKRLNELYATRGQVGFLATKRLDARLILPETIKVLKMK